MCIVKIISCVMLILFAATLGGCSVAKNAIKSIGKTVGKTPKVVKEELGEQAVGMAFDAVTGNNQPTNSRTTNPTTPARTPTKPNRLAGAGVAVVGGAAVAEELLSDDRHWIKDTANGAYVWNPEPQDGESVRWDGGTVRDGDNLYAQGNGKLTWYKNGQVIQVDEGTFEHGRHHGKFKHTFKSGNVDYSNWNHGEEIPLNAPAMSPDDQARQAFLNYHQALRDKRYDDAYATLTVDQQRRVGDFNSYRAGYANTLSSEISNLSTVSMSEDSVTLDYELIARDRIQGNGVKVQTFRGQATLINVGGNWFISYAKSAKVDEYIER